MSAAARIRGTLRELLHSPTLFVVVVIFLSGCAALWMPSNEDAYACAAAVPSDAEGRPCHHIPHAEWLDRLDACRACLIRGGTPAGCAGTYP